MRGGGGSEGVEGAVRGGGGSECFNLHLQLKLHYKKSICTVWLDELIISALKLMLPCAPDLWGHRINRWCSHRPMYISCVL